MNSQSLSGTHFQPGSFMLTPQVCVKYKSRRRNTKRFHIFYQYSKTMWLFFFNTFREQPPRIYASDLHLAPKILVSTDTVSNIMVFCSIIQLQVHTKPTFIISKQITNWTLKIWFTAVWLSASKIIIIIKKMPASPVHLLECVCPFFQSF